MTRLPLLLSLVLLAGCPSNPSAPDAQPCSFTLEWGRRADGVFTPFSDGDTAELTLGFQGFRYVITAARLVDMSIDELDFHFDVAVDGQTPWTQNGRAVAAPAADGSYVDYLLVFFNDVPIAELIDRTATIHAEVTAAGCTGEVTTAVTLVDQEACVEQADGGLTCE